MKHTPGPWTVKVDDGFSGVVITAQNGSGRILAHVDDVDKHDKANAKLMALSPELLEALDGLFEHCAMIHKHWGEGSNAKEASEAQKFALEILVKAKSKS